MQDDLGTKWREHELECVEERTQEKIREHSGNSPYCKLEDELTRASHHTRNPLHLRLPTCEWSKFTLNHDWASVEGRMLTNIGRHCSAEDIIERFERRIRGANTTRVGSVALYDDAATVTLGIRRCRKPTEEQIGEGLYYSQFQSDEWSGEHIGPKLYPRFVAPYLRDETITHPFEWAMRHTQIAIGWLMAMQHGGDFPPAYTEHGYAYMAPKVCNTTSHSLKPPRHYKLDEKRRDLLAAAQEHFPDFLSPELTCFLLRNSKHLTPDLILDPDIMSRFTLLPPCLENGLIIDRLSELFQYQRKAGLESREALLYSLQVITDIYHGEKEPWWFKEDMDMRKVFDEKKERSRVTQGRLEIGNSETGRKIVSEIAAHAAFAFEFVLEAYQIAGYKLAELDGFSITESVQFTARITKMYGIGNPRRAANLLEFVLDFLQEIPSDRRGDATEMLMKHMERQKPRTEIIGRLEGEEAVFNFPGMYGLVHAAFGRERMEREKRDEVTITSGLLKELVEPLRKPLSERAKTPPALRVRSDTCRLLAANLDGVLALPVAKQNLLPAGGSSEITPLLGFLEFYEQVREECGWIDEEVTAPYFSVFALKMPDPFRPPKGFLRFLQKFNRIPDPEYKHSFMCQPNERYAQAERNAERTVDRIMIISNLLDVWIMGLFSWKELMGLFDWMTEEPGEEFKKECETRVRERKIAQRKENEEYRKAHPEEFEDDSWKDDADEETKVGWSESEEAYLQHDIEREYMEPTEEKWQKRFEFVSSQMDYIVALHLLVTTGILTCDEISLPLSCHLVLWKTGKGPEINMGETLFGEQEYSDSLRMIAEFQDLGIINVRAFRESLQHPFLIGNFQSRIKEFFLTLLAVSTCIEEIKTLEWSMMQKLRSQRENGGDTLQEWVSAIAREKDILTEGIKGILFLTDDALDRIFEAHLGIYGYVQVWNTIRSLRTEGEFQKFLDDIGRGNDSRENQELASATSTSLSITTLLGTLTIEQKPETSSRPAIVALREESIQSNPKAVEVRRGGRRSLVPAGISVKHLQPTDSDFRSACKKAIPLARKTIEMWRDNAIGLLPVGGKIHVLHPIETEHFEMFRGLFQFGQTSFRLIHANTSLLLPPMPSAEELQSILYVLDASGVIDSEFPELQVSGVGRLDPYQAGILGSAILLATERGVEYDEKAFSTTHDASTGARMMAYDAGAQNARLPNTNGFSGRTDMLGRRHPNDMKLFQLLHSVLAQEKYGGPFGDFAEEFKKRYLQILRKYGMEQVLDENWICGNGNSTTGAGKRHYENVRVCTDAYFACADRYSETGEEQGIIFEARKLFDWLRESVRVVQESLLENKYRNEASREAVH